MNTDFTIFWITDMHFKKRTKDLVLSFVVLCWLCHIPFLYREDRKGLRLTHGKMLTLLSTKSQTDLGFCSEFACFLNSEPFAECSDQTFPNVHRLPKHTWFMASQAKRSPSKMETNVKIFHIIQWVCYGAQFGNHGTSYCGQIPQCLSSCVFTIFSVHLCR